MPRSEIHPHRLQGEVRQGFPPRCQHQNGLRLPAATNTGAGPTSSTQACDNGFASFSLDNFSWDPVDMTLDVEELKNQAIR
jgi:hypothetical protein